MGFIVDFIKDGLTSGSGNTNKKRESSMIKDLASQPDKFIFTGCVENGEIHITIKRNEKNTPYSE